MNDDAIDDIRDDVDENDDFKVSCRREIIDVEGKKREKGHVNKITLVSAHVTFCHATTQGRKSSIRFASTRPPPTPRLCHLGRGSFSAARVESFAARAERLGASGKR